MAIITAGMELSLSLSLSHGSFSAHQCKSAAEDVWTFRSVAAALDQRHPVYTRTRLKVTHAGETNGRLECVWNCGRVRGGREARERGRAEGKIYDSPFPRSRVSRSFVSRARRTRAQRREIAREKITRFPFRRFPPPFHADRCHTSRPRRAHNYPPSSRDPSESARVRDNLLNGAGTMLLRV